MVLHIKPIQYLNLVISFVLESSAFTFARCKRIQACPNLNCEDFLSCFCYNIIKLNNISYKNLLLKQMYMLTWPNPMLQSQVENKVLTFSHEDK
jgi:hypothetical protein